MKTKGPTLLLPMLALMIATTTACAPLTQASREDREYSRMEYRNKFLEERASCLALRRHFVIQGWGASLDRDGVPRTRVRYHCV